MRLFLYIALIFTFGSSTGQNMHVTHPKLVYPILEEFVSENHLRGTHTFEQLVQIDSIIVEDLGYEVSGDFVRKIFGRRIRTGNRHVIKIDESLLTNPKRFERSLKHELGHVFKLPHLENGVNYLEFMSSEHWEKVELPYKDQAIWNLINNNYYNSFKK